MHSIVRYTMPNITITDLNERAYSALAERLGDRSRKIHGVLAPCPKPGFIQLLWPYGQVVATRWVTDRSQCDDVFLKGRVSLHGFLWNFMRSCQLLGFSICRLEQKFKNDRQELEAHRGEQSWSVEIDLEAPYGEFHALGDVSIHLDSCISYLKILADGVAKTLPSLFGTPPPKKSGTDIGPRDSINKLWDHSRDSGSTLESLFISTPRDWLKILSAKRNEIAGIRDARFHHGAWNAPIGSQVGEGPLRILVSQSSVGEERPGNRPGETIMDSVVHSRDLIADLRAATDGFFSFLDHVVREAVTRDPVLNPARESYSQSGYVLAFGPSDFLGSILPTA
jgi:hypothetical protein